MPKTYPVPVPFIGREEHIKWLARIIFSHERWQLPFIVTGPKGCGKTALVAMFLHTFQNEVDGLWYSIGSSFQVNELLDMIERDLERARSAIVVLDDVGDATEEQLLTACRVAQNFKRVQAAIVATRIKLPIDGASVLTMNGVGRYDVELMIKSAGVVVPEHLIDELVVRIGGNAGNMRVMAGALISEGIDCLARLMKLPLYSVTDEIPKGSIVTIAKPALIYVTNQLVEELQRCPDGIYELSPRRFEELLADLLADQGMEVQLTQETRDGGRDLIAEYDTPAGKILCLVDAKRYRRDRTVGVGLVRQLHGTLLDHKATTAMMVTTSTYSPDAYAYQERHKWHLNLRDFSHVIEWLNSFKSPNSGLILPAS